MDTEDINQLLRQLRQKRLLRRVSEAEGDAESLRAGKYCKILGSLAGEAGATQPHATGIFHMPRRALKDVPQPTSPLTESRVRSAIAAQSPSAHPPVAGRSRPASDRTATAVLQAHSDSDEDVVILDKEPHTGSSTSTPVSQPGSKKRTGNSSSHGNPVQSISTRSRCSFDIPPESSMTSTSDPRSFGMTMPRDIPAVDVAGILKRAGLTALELTRAEATRVEETPGIGWVAFSNLFDGHRKSEGPQCSSSRFPGYNKFFCADDIVQPFVPHAAGKPGLYFRLPTVIKTPENQKHMKQTIHVLSNTFQGDKFYYRGKYTRVPIPENQFHWSDLPHNFRDWWVKRVSNSRTSPICAIRARIQLRNKHRREPSAMEVQAHLKCFNDQVAYKEVAAAFRSGEEKLVVEGLRCSGYDSGVATIIQRAVHANASDDNH